MWTKQKESKTSVRQKRMFSLFGKWNWWQLCFQNHKEIYEKWAWTSFPSSHLLKVSRSHFLEKKKKYSRNPRGAHSCLLYIDWVRALVGKPEKKRHIYDWMYCQSYRTVWRMDANSGVVTSRHHGEMSSILPWCCRFFSSIAPGHPLPPHHVQAPDPRSQKFSTTMHSTMGTGANQRGSSSHCPLLPEFQLCQRRCRGVGLNWRTSAKV